MTSTQYIRLYDFFKQELHIEDDAKAKVFIEEVEKIVDNKFDDEKNSFSPRSDIQELKHQMELLKHETRTTMAEGFSNVKSEINKLIIWIVSTGIAIVGLLLAFLKF